MPRRVFRALDHWWVFLPLVVVYVGLWAMPASVWFDSRSIAISDAKVGEAPIVLEDRRIRFSFYGRYKTVTKDATTHFDTRCEAEADFPYRGGLDGTRSMSLVDWTNEDDDCASIPPGTYYTETCRTVLYPMWGILPSKKTCSTSNIFRIGEK